jgi:hypothetical protein
VGFGTFPKRPPPPVLRAPVTPVLAVPKPPNVDPVVCPNPAGLLPKKPPVLAVDPISKEEERIY